MKENGKIIVNCIRSIAQITAKIIEKADNFIKGNRLMVEKSGYIGVSLFKRGNPERKFVKIALEPDFECPLAAAVAGAVGFIIAAKALMCVVRSIKYRLG